MESPKAGEWWALESCTLRGGKCNAIRRGVQEDSKMLVLSRRTGESIVIGEEITVTVIRVRGRVVQLGFNAPQDVPIHRSELREQIREFESPQIAVL